MSQKIGVLGAGAIGGAIGAYLIQAGHDVILMDQWAAHIEKIRADGLKLTDVNGGFTVPAKALHISDVSGLREQFDIVYLSVKSYDTRWSTYLIEPYLKPTGFILPAQNSLNDEAVASIMGFNRTVGCVPSIGVAVYEPGHIIRTDPMKSHCFSVGELSGIVSPRVLEIVDALTALGHSEATANIWGARWAKLVINCMMNTLGGLIGPGLSSLTPEQRDTANAIRIITGGEVVRVARYAGISVEPIWGIPAQEFAEAKTEAALTAVKARMEEALKKIYLTPEQAKKLGAPSRPSLLQDVIKSRRTEVDYLNGQVVGKGEEVGVPTPMNRAIVELMREVEAGQIDPDPANLEKLTSYLPA
jgi:2-dehydropantoate 2-reductase